MSFFFFCQLIIKFSFPSQTHCKHSDKSARGSGEQHNQRGRDERFAHKASRAFLSNWRQAQRAQRQANQEHAEGVELGWKPWRAHTGDMHPYAPCISRLDRQASNPARQALP